MVKKMPMNNEQPTAYSKTAQGDAWLRKQGVDPDKAKAVEAGARKAGEMPQWFKSAYSAIAGSDKKPESNGSR